MAKGNECVHFSGKTTLSLNESVFQATLLAAQSLNVANTI